MISGEIDEYGGGILKMYLKGRLTKIQEILI